MRSLCEIMFTQYQLGEVGQLAAVTNEKHSISIVPTSSNRIILL